MPSTWETPDPFAHTSRFPLSPGSGPFVPNPAPASGPDTRPFGMRFGVRPVEYGKHSKQPTNKTKTEPTAITDDGKVVGHTPDTVSYVEMDEV